MYLRQGDGGVEVRLSLEGLAMRVVSVAGSPRSPLTAWKPISLCDLAKLLVAAALPKSAWRRK
jgi:hypothetical protein